VTADLAGDRGDPRVAAVPGGATLAGSLRVPGDKSISHRALLVGALAEGESSIEGLSAGEDVVATARAVAALGAGVAHDPQSGRTAVHGGRSRLRAPATPLDCANSGTSLRLLAGVAATLDGATTLTGDESLRSRPTDRVAEPLGLMGAQVLGRGARCLPPVTVSGGALVGIDYTPPMASAQVKSAILLAGLAASGETVVREPVPTRTHTEDMLAVAGARISVASEAGARVVRVRRSVLRPVAVRVPGDPSQAAFWVVGALLAPASRVTVEGLYLGRERVGYLAVLERMGGRIEVLETGPDQGSVTAFTSALSATDVDAAEIPSLDEVPVLAVAASRAEGTSRFRDVAELRVKESDRLTATADLIRAFGGTAAIDGDDLVVTGHHGPVSGATFDPAGDHRMAMAAAVAGACIAGPGSRTIISGWESVATSYPGFLSTLDGLRDGSAAP
jgi:3-phosphoshikimate 1-carboxyvinyltransferase